jgi:hypothetical protein
VVVTGELLPYEVEGTRWITTKDDDTGDTHVSVFGLVPGGGPQGELVAEFPDVHAVFFKDKGQLVPLATSP